MSDLTTYLWAPLLEGAAQTIAGVLGGYAVNKVVQKVTSRNLYAGPMDFWRRGIQEHLIEEDDHVVLDGLISPYTQLFPGNPMRNGTRWNPLYEFKGRISKDEYQAMDFYAGADVGFSSSGVFVRLGNVDPNGNPIADGLAMGWAEMPRVTSRQHAEFDGLGPGRCAEKKRRCQHTLPRQLRQRYLVTPRGNDTLISGRKRCLDGRPHDGAVICSTGRQRCSLDLRRAWPCARHTQGVAWVPPQAAPLAQVAAFREYIFCLTIRSRYDLLQAGRGRR
jgi:hypothetical protein